MSITIDVAGTFGIASRGVTVDVDVAMLPDAIRAAIFEYGLKQVIADAASGAVKDAMDGFEPADKAARDAWIDEHEDEIATSTLTMMSKKVDALYAGDWSTRGAGEGAVSEFVRVARSVCKAIAKERYGSKSPKWAAFTGLDDAEQNAKLDAMYAANADKLQAKVEGEIERRKAAKAAKSKLATGVVIDL